MTILCITSEWLPGIRPCTNLGEHRVTCPDHEGWAEELRPGVCRGCLPRAADRGFLCQRCYDRVEAAFLKWRPFVRLVLETGGRAVSPEGGAKGAAPDGFTNLPLTFLALDECERLLKSRADRTLDVWVHDQACARDSIMFAHAAERAYRALEVEERERQVYRVRCPHCGHQTLTGHTTREQRGATIVECQVCGEQLDKIRTAPTARTESEACEHDDLLRHADCSELACRCHCHDLGRRSTPQGVFVLWDADQHTAGYVDRSSWVFDGATIHQQHDERKIA